MKNFKKAIIVLIALWQTFMLVSCGKEPIEMVQIPGQNYKMSTTEITQGLYESVMGENPSEFKGENNPVEMVNWYDAIYFFLHRLSYTISLRKSTTNKAGLHLATRPCVNVVSRPAAGASEVDAITHRGVQVRVAAADFSRAIQDLYPCCSTLYADRNSFTTAAVLGPTCLAQRRNRSPFHCKYS